MIHLFLALGLIVLAWVIGFGMGLWIGLPDPVEPLASSPGVPTVEPTPVPAPPPKTVVIHKPLKVIERWLTPEPPPAVPEVVMAPLKPAAKVVRTVRIKLVSDRKVDGIKSIPETQRRSKFVQGDKVYQASHRDPDGTWVYRRVKA